MLYQGLQVAGSEEIQWLLGSFVPLPWFELRYNHYLWTVSVMQYSDKGKYIIFVGSLRAWWRPLGSDGLQFIKHCYFIEKKDLIMNYWLSQRGVKIASTGSQSTLSKMIQGYHLGILPTAIHKLKLKIYFLNTWFIWKKLLVLSSERSQETSFCNEQHFSVELST